MKVPLHVGHGMSVGAAGLPFGTTILGQYQMDIFFASFYVLPRPGTTAFIVGLTCEMHKSGQILATTLSHCLRG